MPRYRVRYLQGPNHTMLVKEDFEEEGQSFTEVLQRHSHWPITESYDCKTATAWNPTTCLYYQEMWEASLIPETLNTETLNQDTKTD